MLADGAFICKVTHYVSDGSADSGLTDVFRITDVQRKKKEKEKKPSSLQRPGELHKDSARMEEHVHER